MTKIAVTGGSGKAGRVVVRHLFARGHQVLNIDQVGSPESNHPEDPIPFLRADVTDAHAVVRGTEGSLREEHDRSAVRVDGREPKRAARLLWLRT